MLYCCVLLLDFFLFSYPETCPHFSPVIVSTAGRGPEKTDGICALSVLWVYCKSKLWYNAFMPSHFHMYIHAFCGSFVHFCVIPHLRLWFRLKIFFSSILLVFHEQENAFHISHQQSADAFWLWLIHLHLLYCRFIVINLKSLLISKKSSMLFPHEEDFWMHQPLLMVVMKSCVSYTDVTFMKLMTLFSISCFVVSMSITHTVLCEIH